MDGWCDGDKQSTEHAIICSIRQQEKNTYLKIVWK